MGHETFWTLLSDPAHWCFELFLILLFDVVLGLFIWPLIKRGLNHHTADDKKLLELQKEMAEIKKILGMKGK
jgi:hypothetical protein